MTNTSTDEARPNWSPDGARIAFASPRDENCEICVMNADGCGQIRLTNNAASNSTLVWSPDGRKIAFESNRDGYYEIYVMNADGSGQTRITSNSAHDGFPDQSPDCSKIAFHSERDGNNEIYVMNADGSQQSRLTNNLASDLWPKWSPDGTRITFHSMRDDKLAVHVMNPDGSQQVRMADPNSGNLGPAWQPKAERVVVLLPTSTPLPTAMAVPPTPLGLFVTNLRLDPPSLPPAQDVNFFVTFFNGTGNPARYRWKVLIYKPDNTRNSFGETSAVLPDLPLGSSEQKVGTWRITAGACGDYVAWVAWVDEGNRLVSFTQTNGQIYELPFATCR